MLTNIAEALPQIVQDAGRLASFANDLGRALQTIDDEALRATRNLLAAADVSDAHRAGLISGVLEMIDGFRSAAASAREDDAAQIELREGLSRDVVAALARRATTTSELANALGKEESEISRALRQLRKLDLVESTRDSLDRRVRPHRLSLRGRQLSERAGLTPKLDAECSDELRALITRPMEEIAFPSAGHRTLYSVALHLVADLLGRPWTNEDRITAEALTGLLAGEPGALRARANARAPHHVTWELFARVLEIVDGDALGRPNEAFEASFRGLLAKLPAGSMLRLLWAVAAAKLRTPTLSSELAAYADGVLSGFDLPIAWFWRNALTPNDPLLFFQSCQAAQPPSAPGLPFGLERNLELAKQHTCYTWTVNRAWAPLETRLDEAASRLYHSSDLRIVLDRVAQAPPTTRNLVQSGDRVVEAAEDFLAHMKANPPKDLPTAANDVILQEYVHYARSVVVAAGGVVKAEPAELFEAPTWTPKPMSPEALLEQMSVQREGVGVTCLRIAEGQIR